MPQPSARLSDGTTIKVRTERSIAGTYFREVPSRKRPAALLLRLDGPMFYVPEGPAARGASLVPIRWEGARYAATDADGARKALAFFTRCAEDTIEHAAAEGVAVETCYGTVAA